VHGSFIRALRFDFMRKLSAEIVSVNNELELHPLLRALFLQQQDHFAYKPYKFLCETEVSGRGVNRGRADFIDTQQRCDAIRLGS
jgi:hypothetical protein